jgi:hypothetical protein
MQAYHRTDQHIHQLSQVIAKANRTFVPRKEDDSHTNLGFDPINKRLYGRWIHTSQGRIILALNLGSFSFEWLSSNLMIRQSFFIEGKTMADIESEIENSLTRYDLDPSGFRNDLHFKIPEYSHIKNPQNRFSEMGLGEWIHHRSLANRAAYLVLDSLQVHGEVRIWPHHFDTGIYMEPTDNIGLGFGLAMPDSMVPEAYFYMAGYGLDNYTISFETLPTLPVGHWITTENWKGATLSLSDLRDKDINSLLSFIQACIRFYLN